MNTSSVGHKQKWYAKWPCVGNCIIQKIMCNIFFILPNCANEPGQLSKELACTWLSQSAGQRTDYHLEYSYKCFPTFSICGSQKFPSGGVGP